MSRDQVRRDLRPHLLGLWLRSAPHAGAELEGGTMDISHLILGSGEGDGKKMACMMSARALLDGRPFGDDHSSQVLRRIGIRINDGNWWTNNAERTATLLPLALDDRLCASKCDSSRAAEIERAKLCATWALGTATPMALDAAASALRDRWPESAALLSGHADKLRREPTRDNALASRKAAAYADAAYAAAYAAAAAADAAARRFESRKLVRDSLIALFGRLLDVDTRKAE